MSRILGNIQLVPDPDDQNFRKFEAMKDQWAMDRGFTQEEIDDAKPLVLSLEELEALQEATAKILGPNWERPLPPPRIPPGPDSRKWEDTTLINNLVPVLDERFRVLQSTGKDGSPTRITVAVRNSQVTVLTDDDPELRAYLVQRYSETGVVLAKEAIERTIYHWRTRSMPLEEPAPLTFWPDKTLSFCRVPWKPKEGDWSAWREFTDRCDDPELVMAYVGACFTPENETRQALVLRGDGEDGKSTFLRVLKGALGAGGQAISDVAVTESKRFLLSSIYGKRVVIYPDCKVKDFCLTSIFRAFGSGDSVPIEFKGETIFSAVIRAKLLIGTNEHLDYGSQGADSSRVLPVEVSESKNKDDPRWEARLTDSLPAFVFECLRAYSVRCPNGGKLTVGKAAQDWLADSAEDVNAEIKDAVLAKFDFKPEGRVSAKDFRKALPPELRAPKRLGDARKWLEQQGVRRIEGTDRERYYVGLALRPPAASPFRK